MPDLQLPTNIQFAQRFEDSTITDFKCQKCPLWETSVAGGRSSGKIMRSGVYGRGTGRNGLLIYGEALGHTEIIIGRPFVGDAGKLLSEVLSEIGIVESQSYITNTVRCRPPSNRVPVASEQDICMENHFTKDLPAPDWKPKLVLTLGAVALRSMLHMQKISERRGIFYDSPMFAGVKTLCTYHPAAILRKPELYPILRDDIRRAKDYLNNTDRGDLPPVTNIQIRTRTDFLEWMDYLLSADPRPALSVDIESTGLNYRKDKIVSISMSFYSEDNYVSLAFLTDARPEWWHLNLTDKQSLEFKLLQTLLESSKLTFQNGDFDTKFFWYNGIHAVSNIDTLDAHYLLDENSPHGLKHLVSMFLPKAGGYQQKILEVIGGDWDIQLASVKDLLEYNASDAFFTHLLRDKFLDMLKHQGLKDLFEQHAMPLKRALTCMSYRGIRMDRDRIMRLSETYRKEIKEKEEKLYDLVGQRFKYTSQSQLIKVLYQDLGLPVYKETKTGPSTDKETMEELAKLHPVPALIVSLRHARKMCQTYLDGNDGISEDKGTGILGHLDEYDRVHASFLTHGTTSGRLASKEPSLLNIPRDLEFRRCFIPQQGWQFINADYSQAELILLAYLSKDPSFINAVTSEDLHTKVLRTLVGIDESVPIDKEMRNFAKAINFRKAYGGGSKGLAAQLGVEEELTASWYKKWDAAYPGIPEWMESQATLWQVKGEVVSIYGRKRRFPNLQVLDIADPKRAREQQGYYDRLSINFPCQAGVADTMNRTLRLLHYYLNRIWPWSPSTMYNHPGAVLTVHDELLFESPEELVPDMCELIRGIMSLPLPMIGISLKSEMKVLSTWGGDV